MCAWPLYGLLLADLFCLHWLVDLCHLAGQVQILLCCSGEFWAVVDGASYIR